MENSPAETQNVKNHLNMMAKGGKIMNLPMILPL